jgi:hypothetical protein
LSTTKLTDSVYKALDAILIERMRDAFAKSSISLPELIAKHDSNRDGALEYKELENLLLELQIAFRGKAFERLCSLLDPAKKAGKVSANRLKFFIQSDATLQV